ncbi:MAG: cysteine hydrolase [Chloroflexi bacterium]|nr:cysteine hydrolase [Chloroflexota bacterium]
MLNDVDKNELKAILKPEQALVVVIDMQNDFCAPNGAMDLACKNRPGEDLTLIQGMAPVLREFLHRARTKGVRVAFVQNLRDPSGLSAPYKSLFARRKWGNSCQPGTWGADFYEVTTPAEQDRRFTKFRYSIFTNPDFPTYLRMNRIEALVVTGVGTPVCVESTVRDAFMADFHVVVPRDCVATYSRELHENSLRIMGRNFAWVVDSADVIAAWPPQGV